MIDPKEALAQLTQGAAQIISESELLEKLALGRPLRIKLGADPTSPDLHLGHTIALRKLRQFQDLGHEAILIIGDFTAMIGDPSGRSATRPQLSHEQVLANAESYREQAFKVLDPARTRIVFNGEWFAKMRFQDVLRLNSLVTLQQMLQREDFRHRMEQTTVLHSSYLPQSTTAHGALVTVGMHDNAITKAPDPKADHPSPTFTFREHARQVIHVHEIQYPIMQGWDSVMVQADVELGGTDQLFNNLVGRDLQKQEGQLPQVVLLVPILEGLGGVKKMSKSLGNYIGINEPAAEIFGKIMSISDDLMVRYYNLLLGRDLPPDEHPLEAKKKLGAEIVRTYHSAAAAEKVVTDWNARFSEKRLADTDLPEFRAFETAFGNDAVSVVCAAYSSCFQLNKSRTEARRLIEQGSVQIDGVKVSDPKATLSLLAGQVLRLDKTRAVKIGTEPHP